MMCAAWSDRVPDSWYEPWPAPPEAYTPACAWCGRAKPTDQTLCDACRHDLEHDTRRITRSNP